MLSITHLQGICLTVISVLENDGSYFNLELVIPFQSVYNASKAAMSIMSQAMRLELNSFGVTVIELRTGGVKTNIAKNVQAQRPQLPDSSIYAPAKELVEKALMYEWFEGMGITA